MGIVYYYQYDLGKIGIEEQDGKITVLYLPGEEGPLDREVSETPLLKEGERQLKAYFSGKLKDFSLPLDPLGTDFMKRVWNSLCEIPYGQTVSYKEIAQRIGSPKAARAVGQANNRNPIPIFIPCHRVIGADGSMVGYGGGLAIKKFLLDLEKNN